MTCNECSGSGDCQNCDATGKVVCSRCDGTGWYQTFRIANTTDYARGAIGLGDCNVKEFLAQASGETIFNGVYKSWESFNILATDESEKRDQEVERSLGPFASKYKDCLAKINSSEAFSPANQSDGRLRSQMAVTEVDHLLIRYSINGKEYTVDLLGNNHLAAYDEVPTVMEEFKLGKVDRYKMAFSEKRRLKAMALMAAYIYGCDGWNPAEVRVLKCLVAELEKRPEKRARLFNKLVNVHSTMSEDEVIKKSKPMFVSKKGLTFVWHCMNTDHTISPQEEELFTRLTTLYPDLSAEDLNTIKLRAHKFNKLSDEYLIKEYADISPDSAGLRKNIYVFTAISIAVILAVAGIIWLFSNVPSSSSYDSAQDNNWSEVVDKNENEHEKSNSDDINLDSDGDDMTNELDSSDTPIMMLGTSDHDGYLDLTIENGKVTGQYTNYEESDTPMEVDGTYNNKKKLLKLTIYDEDHKPIGKLELEVVEKDYTRQMKGTLEYKGKKRKVKYM